MVWHEEGHAVAGDEVKEGTFWRADLTEAADLLVEVIREVRPQLLVTYDQFGGYGHPDHIQAHRVAMYAAQLAAVPSYARELGEPWEIAKIYWGAMSESRMRASLRSLREAGDTTTFEGMDPDGQLPPFVTSDDNLSAAIDGSAYLEQKMAALRSYPTLKHGRHLRAWVLAIARNVAVDVLRKRRVTSADVPDLESVDEPLPYEELRRLTAGLPRKERAAVFLRYGYDLPYSDIGTALGSSEEAARQAASSGVRRLRRRLQ